MKPTCEHNLETLIHGLETLSFAQEAFEEGDTTRAKTFLDSFVNHEADEVGVYQQALEVSSFPTARKDIYLLRKAFVQKAVEGLLECECGG